jgi:thioredoxin reductase
MAISTPQIAIIGAGPAGTAAAIQLGRYGLKPHVFERNTIGGLLKNARFIENYPGFPKGISGPGLVKKLRQHFKKTGFEIVNESVIELDYSNAEFHIKTNLLPHTAQIVIVATGTKPRVPDETFVAESVQDRVFYEVYPIRNTADKRVIVVGAGDAAFDYALNLAKKNEVIVLNRGSRIRALPVLKEEMTQTESIKYFEDMPIHNIADSDGGSLVVGCSRQKRTIEMEADYVIFAIGREPELSFLSNKLKEQVSKLEKKRKLFLVGDVKNAIYRQAAIAAGDGIRAAMEIYRSIKNDI